MGKIDISEDLRNKLNKVLSYKSVDIGDTPVGPAPTWKPPVPKPPEQPQQPLEQHSSQHYQQQPQPPPEQYYNIKPKKKKDKIKYYKITKIVFLSSVVAGIGLTLGLKIANILFF